VRSPGRVGAGPVDSPAPAREDRMVNHLMQEDGEIEDRETLDEHERDPHQWVLETDERPGRQAENAELTPATIKCRQPDFRWNARNWSREMAAPSSARNATACCE
jgi:hypothetical protein